MIPKTLVNPPLCLGTTCTYSIKYIFFFFNVLSRWLYLANKKHGNVTHQENIKNAKTDDMPVKNGIENKAFEAEDSKLPSKLDANEAQMADSLESSVNQSQIEMGFTESMLCTSKL